MNRVESYALGMSLRENLPHVFYVDDIEIITREEYPGLFLYGEEWVSVPTSGELAVFYTAQVRMPGDAVLKDAVVEWSCEGLLSDDILCTPQGKLTVPAGVESQKIAISAVFSTGSGTIMNTKEVHILGLDSQAEASLEPTATLFATPIPTDYQQFSANFEKWTTGNRTLFMILLVGGILVILAVLSALQRRLK